MGRRRSKGRPVSGVLLLNKPQGVTSNGALQRAKRLFFAQKAGHTGSLDPLATGVLPLCFGEATKFSQYLLDADKRYTVTYQLGAYTTTGDSDGELLDPVDASDISRQQVAEALQTFVGEIDQVPPMYSALKHEGQPLYKLARQGIEVERKARRITVYSADMLDFRAGPQAEVDVDVHCSKGTYIRSIGEDLGKLLGCGAHVTRLHRTQAGPFDVDNAVTLEVLEEERGEGLAEALDHHLLPTDAPVAALPELDLDEHSVYYFQQGQAIMDSRVYRIGDEGDIVRVFAPDGRFLGLAEIDDESRLAPKRLVVETRIESQN